MILYGIKNCDSVKKSRVWLDGRCIPYSFHDFRKEGIDKDLLVRWLNLSSLDLLLNKQSSSWRRLEAHEKDDLTDDKALELMLNNPTLIKRPVLDLGLKILIGFKPYLYENEL